MTTISVELTDNEISGLTWALNKYNLEHVDATLATKDLYAQLRLKEVCTSYFKQQVAESAMVVQQSLQNLADTGEFAIKLAQAVQNDPNGLVAALSPLLGFTPDTTTTAAPPGE